MKRATLFLMALVLCVAFLFPAHSEACGVQVQTFATTSAVISTPVFTNAVFVPQVIATPVVVGGGVANVNVVQRGGLFGRRTTVIQASAGGGAANVNVVRGRR